MNRRGFFAGLLGVIGLGAAAAAARGVPPTTETGVLLERGSCDHAWKVTPYVLVFGETVVQRGPRVRLCARCGALAVDVQEHREAQMQAAYDAAHNAATSRMDRRGFPEYVTDTSGLDAAYNVPR